MSEKELRTEQVVARVKPSTKKGLKELAKKSRRSLSDFLNNWYEDLINGKVK